MPCDPPAIAEYPPVTLELAEFVVPPADELPPEPGVTPLPPLEVAEPPAPPAAALVEPPWLEVASPLVLEQAHSEDAAMAISRIFFMGLSLLELMGKTRQGIVDRDQLENSHARFGE